jgi:anti-sigma B factor antagonist
VWLMGTIYRTRAILPCSAHPAKEISWMMVVGIEHVLETRRRAVMDIRIEERPVGGVTIVDIVGRLTIDRAAQHLKDKINSLISQQRTHIVLNLEDVPYIDSGGLGQLVASYGAVMKAGGALKLLNVGSRNHDLLSITRLVTLFESFDSEEEAVQSFAIPDPALSR